MDSRANVRAQAIRVSIVVLLFRSLIALLAGIYSGIVTDRKLTKVIAVANHDDPDWELHNLIASRIEVPDDENSAILVNEVGLRIPGGWLYPPRSGDVAFAP